MQQDKEEWELPDPARLSDPDAVPEPAPSAPREASAISRVLDAKRDELMSLPGVTMVGETADASGNPAIMVGVVSEETLRDIPASIEGFPVIGNVTGEVMAQPASPPEDPPED